MALILGLAVTGILVGAVLVAGGWIPGLGRSGGANGPLTVSVLSSAADGYTPFQVTLTASVSGGTPPYAIHWVLPDATTASGPSLVLPLSIPGGYSVRATASDSGGASSSASRTIVAVSPLPEAATVVPAPTGDPNVVLQLRSTSSQPVSSCFFAGWGFLSIPPFERCGAMGGSMQFGTTASDSYAVDPDDPEATPVLFQATQSGIQIQLNWWYNGTAGTESSGTVGLTTAIAPL